MTNELVLSKNAAELVRIDVNADDSWILLTSLRRSEVTRFVMAWCP